MNDENEKEFDAYYLNNCFANCSQSTNFPTYKKMMRLVIARLRGHKTSATNLYSYHQLV